MIIIFQSPLISILFMVIPVYIAELAPKKLRGKLVALISVNLTGGILVLFSYS